jgi:hypothetical protein
MPINNTFLKIIPASAVDTNSGYVDTHNFAKITIFVDWTSDLTGDGTLTFYGSPNGDASSPSKYKLGVTPTLTGTLDSDGAITMGTTSGQFTYEITGVHPWIYLDWNNTADVQSITVYLLGKEEY